MTVMRAEVGKLMLDNVFRERANLNMAIVGKNYSSQTNPFRLDQIRHDTIGIANRVFAMPIVS